jgi:GNAT superfamily N-acetyltransferase
VAPTHQRAGIGSRLFDRVFEPFGAVRQKVLITDDEPRQQAFYHQMGFVEIREMNHPIRAFVRFN